jgi:adenylate kinases
MFKILLLAPPAAGKGTQAKNICEVYNIIHISTGDLLRKEREKKKNNSFNLESGNLVDDNVVLGLLEKRIDNSDCLKGYVLDGFPRNISQAHLLDNLLENRDEKLDVVILLELPYEEAKNRITGRLSCMSCGQVYNDKIESLMPTEKNKCDFCLNHPLIKREDDNETTFENRYNIYLKETSPLIEYYENKKILVRINSNQEANKVFEEIKDRLKEISK